MRPVILYIATSLDGYIARPDDQIDWLETVPNPDGLDYGYQAFLDSIDTTLMGYRTYQVIRGFGGSFPYPTKTNYVFSRVSHLPDDNPVLFVNESPADFVRKLVQQPGGAIWLIGGGQLVSLLLQASLVDQLIVSVMPVLIGQGLPLAGLLAHDVSLRLTDSQIFTTGVVQLTYQPDR